MVNINDSVMVPLGPPKVITAAERQRSGVILRQLAGDCISRNAQHGRNPEESKRDYHQSDQQNNADQRDIADIRVRPAGHHGARQLHAQKNEHRTVERETQHTPY